MYYILSAATIFLLIILAIRLMLSGNQPGFLPRSLMSPQSQKLAVIQLATSCATFTNSGRGLSLSRIKKYADKCYRIIAGRALCGSSFQFENRIYDSFYLFRDKIGYLKKAVTTLRHLPHCGDFPRIYLFCQLVVKSNQGDVSLKTLKNLIADFNNISPLTYGEIAALPMCLEYALMEYLTIFCMESVKIDRSRRAAERDSTKNRIDLSSITDHMYLYFYANSCDLAGESVLSSVAATNDINVKSGNDAFLHLVSSYSGSVEAAIGTLNALKTWLTDEFLLEISPLHQLLSSEKIVYKECTMPTKNIYLFHIARRAKRARKGELAFARELITMANAQGKDIAQFVLPRAGGRVAMRLYIASILLFSALLCLSIALLLGKMSIFLAILFFPSAVAITVRLVSELNARAVFRRYLPRKKLEEEHQSGRALIVYCGLAATKEEIRKLFFSLQTARFANPNPIFNYALLLDFPASDSAENDSDAELLEECKRQFSQLSLSEKSRMSQDSSSASEAIGRADGLDTTKSDTCRYNIFIRKRKEFSQNNRKSGKNKAFSKNRYQGWEKKRGAIINLNDYLLGGNGDEFKLILGSRPPAEFVITLDCDTLLNCAEELVEIMQHPYNKEKCIVSVKAKTNPYTVTTAFTRLMCGALGLDGYGGAVAESAYDLFDSGNYTGKGIYRVREFNQKLKEFFPDGRILSHDFIEGAVAGCGSCECSVDTYPATFSQFMARAIRWLRGDWQLLPYLFKSVKNKHGEKVKNPISPIAKWHIFCNMLFSLLPVTAFAGLFLASFSGAPLPAVLVTLGYFILSIFSALRGAILHGHNPIIGILQPVFNLAVLPIVAVYNLCAILLTLFRLAANRRLLEWKTFAHAKGRISIIPSVLAALAFAAFAVFLGNFWLNIALSALFMSGIVLVFALNYEFKSRRCIDDSLKFSLLKTAQKTWNFFEKAGDGLVSDNYQAHMNLGFADRTSPTNIGFSLLAVVCAHLLNFIDENEKNRRLLRIVEAIERLEKWHGNLYNWTDLRGNLLYPKYVSSVDNGNLLACLLVAESYAENDADNALKNRIKSLIDGMDFGKLYDKKRGLLHIGFNDTYKTFDGHYDLMASESMLTYLVTIGCGKIPKASFENLSKNGLKAYGRVALASWTGGMFEYLMSAIFVNYPPFGMLRQSSKAVINAHKNFAKHCGLPFWGCSESQYNYTDDRGNYQYRAFGVPGIANSNHAGEKVVAPYASMLALSLQPKAVRRNLLRMESAGMMGEYGLFESMDDGEIIKTHMAHHQGMILASVCNYLCDDAIIKSLKKNPAIAAAELLLTQEEFSAVSKKRKPMRARVCKPEKQVVARDTYPPRYNLLSGGKYALVNGSDGSGWSVYNGVCVSRNEGGNGGLKIFVSKTNIHENDRICYKDNQKPSVYVRHNIKTAEYYVRHSTDSSHENYPDFAGMDSAANSTQGFSHITEFSGNMEVSGTDGANFDANANTNISAGADNIVGNNDNTGDANTVSMIKPAVTDFRTMSEMAADRCIQNYSFENSKNNDKINVAGAKVFDISAGKKVFSSYKTEYQFETDEFLATQTSIALPNLHGEMHKISIKNKTDRRLTLVVSSFFQPALTDIMQDLSHKTFSSMKLRTELKDGVIIASRRDARHPLYLAHYFDCEGAKYETNRHNLKYGKSLPSFGAVLYPALSGNKVLHLSAGESASFNAFVLVSENLDSLLKETQLARGDVYSKQALSAAHSLSALNSPDRKSVDFLSSILHSESRLGGAGRPVVLLDAEGMAEGLVRELKNLAKLQKVADFVVAITFKELPGYQNKIFDKISYFIEKTGVKNVHLQNTFNNAECLLDLKLSAVRVQDFKEFLSKGDGEIKAQNNGILGSRNVCRCVPMVAPALDLSLGGCGFFKDSSFFIEVNGQQKRPWSNVIGSRGIGTVVTESGGGYTFFENSGTFKITEWANEPLEDTPSEGVILSEGDTVWSITKKPLPQDVCGHNGASEGTAKNGKFFSKNRDFVLQANDTYSEKAVGNAVGDFDKSLDANFDINQGRAGCKYFCHHSFGFTEFKCNFNGFIATQTEFIDRNKCKFKRVVLRNFEDRPRKIGIDLFLNLVMGDNKQNTRGNIDIRRDGEEILVTNRQNGKSVFVYCSVKIKYYVRHRQVIFDQTSLDSDENQQMTVFENSCTKDILKNPSLALGTQIEVPQGGTAEIVFCISAERMPDFAGHAAHLTAHSATQKLNTNNNFLSGDCGEHLCENKNPAENTTENPVKNLAENRTQNDANTDTGNAYYSVQNQNQNHTQNQTEHPLINYARESLLAGKEYYKNLSALSLQFEDKAMHHLVKWLPYQSLSCRFFARAGYYQAGGAIGFRDQLQDCLSLLYFSPQLVKNHILDCAAHQFEEGDVQHWWHPPKMGVRTKITDDFLYLPWAVAEYIKFSGDKKILKQIVPFLKGKQLEKGERDAYFSPEEGESATLYEHCLRALFCNQIADNDLVLMGGGDWNDAMDKVGHLGSGTSVFGSMFLYFVINTFLPLVRDTETRKRLLERALRLKNGVENAWDGSWFSRAVMDNGQILGSKNSAECKIDLLTQAWASLSKIAGKKQTKTALKSAADKLIDFENGIIKLLSPPFKNVDAGYISHYPEGIRENGGQYTHAAIWFIMAFFGEDCPEFAYSLMEMINPINHSKNGGTDKYMTEPYVLCGDVYSGDFAGCGGWSWYTGAAGWYYKCVVESLLGIKIRAGKLGFEPRLPKKIRQVGVTLQTDFGKLDITIDNTGSGEWTVFVDNVRYNIAYLLISPSLKGKKITVKRA